jgi:hypothetical protein
MHGKTTIKKKKGIVDVELVCTKVLVPTTEVFSHLNDIALHEIE